MDVTATINELLNLATPDNQARASELLTELSDTVTNLSVRVSEQASEITRLSDANSELTRVNGKLFLKVGHPAGQAETEPQPTGTDTGEKLDLKFEDLFNEKGELKK